MPVRLKCIRFFGPEPGPEPGAELTCRVWCRHLGRREVRADMAVVDAAGALWAAVEGWEDWRFETDERLWAVMREPERHRFAEITKEGLAIIVDPERSAASRDYLARRYLNEVERTHWETKLPPRRRQEWLYGRIAAKDAARWWLQENDVGLFYPAELTVMRGETGPPRVSGPFSEELHLSIAHTESVAVAWVLQDRPVGVDVERKNPRTREFGELVCSPAELALLPEDGRGGRDDWLTRAFCAKEVVGKRRGYGLRFAPKRLPVTAVEDENGEQRLRVDGEWVTARDVGEFVVAWGEGEET